MSEFGHNSNCATSCEYYDTDSAGCRAPAATWFKCEDAFRYGVPLIEKEEGKAE